MPGGEGVLLVLRTPDAGGVYLSAMSSRFVVLNLLAASLVSGAACASSLPYEGMTPDEMYALGEERFQDEDWDGAADVLDPLLLSRAGGTFERAPEARMMLARAYFNDERYLTAMDEYNRFLNGFASHELAPRAALGVCESLVSLSPIAPRDQTYTEQAVFVCGNVALNYGGLDPQVGEEANAFRNAARARLAEKVYENGHFYSDRGWWDSAIIYYRLVFDSYGDTQWAPCALLEIVRAYDEIGYEDEVTAWRQTLINAYPDSEEALGLTNGGAHASGCDG